MVTQIEFLLPRSAQRRPAIHGTGVSRGTGILPVRTWAGSPCHGVRSVRAVLLIAAFTVVGGRSASAQLDETWTVTVNGQNVQVNPDGSFRIPNISAADQFGAGGPGTSPDFRSDDILILTGRGLVNGVPMYVISVPFQLGRGTNVLGPDDLFYSTSPPPFPDSIRITADPPVVAAGQTSQITVIGTLLDGTEVDVTPRTAGTIYRLSSSNSVNLISSSGLLFANAPGTVFVTATNFGATAIARVDIVVVTTPTTVEGFVQLADGSPVAGAQVTTNLGDDGVTTASGLFSIPADVPVSAQLSADATANVGGVDLAGTSVQMPVIANGVTDLGIITLSGSPPDAPPYLFSTPAIPILNARPTVVRSGILNADNRTDLAVATDVGSIDVYFNSPGARFGSPAGIPVDSVSDFVLANLDTDDDLDIAALSATFPNSQAVIAINNGNGTFSGPVSFPLPNFYDSLQAGDVDGNGTTDLVFGSTDNGIEMAILPNNGDAIFGAPQLIPLNSQVANIRLVHLNGDDDLDIALLFDVTTCSKCGGQINGGKFGVMLNDGAGGFEPVVEINTLGSSPFAMELGHLNDDEFLDAVVAPGDNVVRTVLGNGDGTFSPPVDSPLNEFALLFVIDDFNGDGDGDVIAFSDRPDTLHLLTGNGDGTLDAPRRFPTGEEPASAVADDWDGDGDRDLAVCNRRSQNVSLMLNNGSGGFPRDAFYATGGTFDFGEAEFMTAADFNGDGDIDILTNTGQNLGVFLNGGKGSFVGPVPTELDCRPFLPLFAADFDGDGNNDAAYATSCNNAFRVLFNAGDGRLARPVEAFHVDGGIQFSAVGDLNNDGRPDLVAADQSGGGDTATQRGSNGRLIAALNLSGGAFSPGIETPHNLSGLQDMVVAEFTGDADRDVVAIGNNVASLFPGNGDGSFSARTDYALNGFPRRVGVGLLNNDAFLDLIIALENGIIIFFNDGTGAPAAVNELPDDFDIRYERVYVAEMDGVNGGDIVAVPGGEHFDGTVVWLNLGGGSFGPPTVYASPAFQNSDLAIADFDGDGDLDIARGRQGSQFDGLAVLLNRTVPNDCNTNGIVDDIDLAAGGALDCNENGFPDACDSDCDANTTPDDCDVAAGAPDCDGDHIPDECDTDCNKNGAPDDCDLAGLVSIDCNENRIPDECEIDAGSPDVNADGILDECERRYFVDDDAPVDGDGLTWATAFNDLQVPLTLTDRFGAGSRTEIWVAAGIYRPATATTFNRFVSFNLRKGASLFGGFAGNEDPAAFDLADRDFAANETILSGDLNGNDTADFVGFMGCFSGPGNPHAPGCEAFDLHPFMVGDGDVDADDQNLLLLAQSFDNSFHVVAARSVDRSAVLDGFTITGGNSNSTSIGTNETQGGGMFVGFFAAPASPTVRKCRFVNNFGNVQGGALHVAENTSEPLFDECVFEFNRVNSGGGAASIVRSSRPVFRRCQFVRNNAGGFGGGGVSITDSARPFFANCTFLRNFAGNGGAINSLNSTGSSTFVNCLVNANVATGTGRGGAVQIGDGSLSMINCTIVDNRADQGGAARTHAFSPFLTFTNCVIRGNARHDGTPSLFSIENNTPGVGFSNIQGGFAGMANIDADPLFSDSDGPDDIPNTLDDDFRLLNGSPCIDAGNNASLRPDTADLDADGDTAEITPHDLDDNPRVAGTTVEMGPYELP
ncbi:MAG: hypothetical protein HOP29_07885 [Phycisphaerales bacterium]|nr:hypothetical protein [Phycisphaerales bacterium]